MYSFTFFGHTGIRGALKVPHSILTFERLNIFKRVLAHDVLT